MVQDGGGNEHMSTSREFDDHVEIANVRDVTESPPANWDHSRRAAYLDWTQQVIAGCRGTNDRLERYYDQVLEAGRAKLALG
jgi:hypothetical protein